MTTETELSKAYEPTEVEARWYAPHVPGRFVAVDWYTVGGQGAWGVTFGTRYRFGGAK